MTDDAVLLAIRSWLVSVTDATAGAITGLPSAGYAPAGDCLTLQMLTRQSRIESIISDGTLTVTDRARVTVDVNGYGSDGTQWVRIAAARWGDLSDASETLRAAGVAPVQGDSFAAVRRLDAFRFTSDEPRAQAQLVAHVETVLHTETSSVIDTITVAVDDEAPYTIEEPTP